MRKATNSHMLKVEQMSPDQLMDAMCNGKLRDDLEKTCPPDEMKIVYAINAISSKASDRISKTVSQMHGRVSDVNPPTPERRGDYFRLCLFVASNIFSRALAMYEPEDREKLLEDFQQLSHTQALLMRHEVDRKVKTDDNSPEGDKSPH